MNKHQIGEKAKTAKVIDTLYSPESEIMDESHLDSCVVGGNCSFYGNPRSKDSTFSSFSRLRDRAMVFNSSLTGFSEVNGEGYVFDSFLQDRVIVSGKSSVSYSWLSDDVRVAENSTVAGADLQGQIIVTGNAVVGTFPYSRGERLLIKGSHYIHEGTWIRPPLHLEIQVGDYKNTMTECIHGKVIIGCICNTPDKWRKAGFRYAEQLGIPNEAQAIMYDFLKLFEDKSTVFIHPFSWDYVVNIVEVADWLRRYKIGE